MYKIKSLVLSVFILSSLNLYSQIKKEKNLNWILSLGAGISFPAGEMRNEYKTGYGLQINGTHAFSKLIAVRADFQVDYFSSKDLTRNANVTFYTTRADFLLGNFKKTRNVRGYFLIGFGLRYEYHAETNVETVYYDPYFGEYVTSSYFHESYWESQISLGIGIGGNYSLNKKLGLYGELGCVILEALDPFSDQLIGSLYFPLKVGIIYFP